MESRLTNDNHIFFRAISQTKLYRIKTGDQASGSTNLKVETVAKTSICHRKTADKNGNIFLSDSPDNSVTYVSPDGKLHTLIKYARISWPDFMEISPDGYLYFSCSQLNRLPEYHHGVNKTDCPYRIYKVKLP